MIQCGCVGDNVSFLMTDNQIKSESFLEDLNNVLNSGEIPNMFEKDKEN